ncbi:MAG: hypothetical protein ACREHG_06370 [Candidatus Saccharimonadales bacterium]
MNINEIVARTDEGRKLITLRIGAAITREDFAQRWRELRNGQDERTVLCA